MRPCCLVLLAATLVSAAPSRAQTGFAVIEGRVHDESDAPLRGATVTATGTQAGQEASARTDAEGRYRIEGLAAGLYVVTVQALPGFAEVHPAVKRMESGETAWLDVAMRTLTLEELLDIPVVTATKTEQRVASTPAIVTVITADEIRERGYESLAEALRTVPGLSVWDDNLISSISIRGFNSVRGWSQTLKIMIDGQPVSFRTGSTYFIDQEFVPIRAVQRIEIIQGPGSALYGANAFLGVVNVITRDFPARGGRTDVSFGLTGGGRLATDRGEPESAGADAMVAGRWGDLGLLAAASYLYSDRSGLALPQPAPTALSSAGTSANDLARPASVIAKLGYQDVTLRGSLQRFDSYGEFTDFSVLTHQNRLTVDNWFVRGDFDRSLGKRADLKLFLAYGKGDPTGADHLDTGSSRFWIKRELGVESVDAGAEVHVRPNERVSLVGGTDYTTDDQQLQNNILVFKDGSGQAYQNPSQVLGRKRFDNFGAYAQGIWLAREKLDLTAGVRLDSHNIYGEDVNWRLAAVYAFEPNVRLKLLAATSFKAPTPRELYDVAGTSRGNPDLLPQRARTFEAAFEKASGTLGGSVGAFFNHLTDVVKLVTPAEPVPGVQKTYANIATIDSFGVSAELRYARGDFQGYANAFWQRSRDADTDQDTALVPRATASLGVGHGLSRRLYAHFEASLVGRRTSPKPASLAYAPPVADPAGFEVGSYVLGSLTLSTRNLRLFGGEETLVVLGIRNLFDAEYVDPGYENRGIDVPHAGRTTYARVVQRF